MFICNCLYRFLEFKAAFKHRITKANDFLLKNFHTNFSESMNIDEVVMHGGSGVGGAGGGIGTGPIGGVGMCNESKSLTFTNDFDMISTNNSLNQVPRSSQI